jgi:NDP-sugar pyrophosphorylase family protein
MKALILSGGLGTRLGNLTKENPKVMIPINGMGSLERNILQLKENDIREIGINTHFLPDKIKDYFGNGNKFGVSLEYSYEQIPLGSAGALNNFREYLTEDFLVLYGDVVSNFDIRGIISEHQKNKELATIGVDIGRDSKEKGIVLVDGGRVIELKEKPGATIEGALINSGVYVLSREIFDLIPAGFSDFGKEILPKAIKTGRVNYFVHNGYIFDIGTKEDLKKAEEYLRRVEN